VEGGRHAKTGVWMYIGWWVLKFNGLHLILTSKKLRQGSWFVLRHMVGILDPQRNRQMKMQDVHVDWRG
jgi:hypothetical protein